MTTMTKIKKAAVAVAVLESIGFDTIGRRGYIRTTCAQQEALAQAGVEFSVEDSDQPDLIYISCLDFS